MKKQAELKPIIESILAADTPETEIKTARELADFFNKIHQQKKHFEEQIQEVSLTGGVALSPHHAAMCVEDCHRTARFIKGVHRAILAVQHVFPNQQINILYAGCGPYGTILLPLLPFFDPEKLDITLLDYNQFSVDQIKQTITLLGLDAYQIACEQADAINYNYPAHKPLHLLITETMFKGLEREPQVAVTSNLAPQLHPEGILIPEEITIRPGYSKYGDEPFLLEGMGFHRDHKTHPNRNLLNVIFRLNKQNHYQSLMQQGKFVFESAIHTTPQEAENFPDICLYTQVRIFDELLLNTSESLITNPICVGSIPAFGSNVRFSFTYHFETAPKWELNVI